MNYKGTAFVNIHHLLNAHIISNPLPFNQYTPAAFKSAKKSETYLNHLDLLKN